MFVIIFDNPAVSQLASVVNSNRDNNIRCALSNLINIPCEGYNNQPLSFSVSGTQGKVYIPNIGNASINDTWQTFKVYPVKN